MSGFLVLKHILNNVRILVMDSSHGGVNAEPIIKIISIESNFIPASYLTEHESTSKRKSSRSSLNRIKTSVS